MFLCTSLWKLPYMVSIASICKHVQLQISDTSKYRYIQMQISDIPTFLLGRSTAITVSTNSIVPTFLLGRRTISALSRGRASRRHARRHRAGLRPRLAMSDLVADLSLDHLGVFWELVLVFWKLVFSWGVGF
jgi:hypothetical protein